MNNFALLLVGEEVNLRQTASYLHRNLLYPLKNTGFVVDIFLFLTSVENQRTAATFAPVSLQIGPFNNLEALAWSEILSQKKNYSVVSRLDFSYVPLTDLDVTFVIASRKENCLYSGIREETSSSPYFLFGSYREMQKYFLTRENPDFRNVSLAFAKVVDNKLIAVTPGSLVISYLKYAPHPADVALIGKITRK